MRSTPNIKVDQRRVCRVRHLNGLIKCTGHFIKTALVREVCGKAKDGHEKTVLVKAK